MSIVLFTLFARIQINKGWQSSLMFTYSTGFSNPLLRASLMFGEYWTVAVMSGQCMQIKMRYSISILYLIYSIIE